MARQSEWFENYEVRVGDDGKPGIYTRGYNVRLATFNRNTAAIQTRLKLMFNHAHTIEENRRKRPRKKRRTVKPMRPGDIDVMGGGYPPVRGRAFSERD